MLYIPETYKTCFYTFRNYQHSSENKVQNEEQHFTKSATGFFFLQHRHTSKLTTAKENKSDPALFSEHTHSPAVS